MESLAQWFTVYENAVAFLVTLGVALFVVCCLECMTAPPRDKDDIFNRHAL
ncbi:MAG TPA: hypothetical protein VKF63_14490 [Terracidiphilus sp.]|nr:hypothetical protein [Terracidiphilus sp.]